MWALKCEVRIGAGEIKPRGVPTRSQCPHEPVQEEITGNYGEPSSWLSGHPRKDHRKVWGPSSWLSRHPRKEIQF